MLFKWETPLAMKIHFRNFSRIGSRFPWAKEIPEHLVVKPRLLSLWEYCQLFLFFSFGFLAVFSYPKLDFLIPLSISIGYISSALLMAWDNDKYRIFSTITVVVSLIFFWENDKISILDWRTLIIPTALLLIVLYMYCGKKAKRYYMHCKSNG